MLGNRIFVTLVRLFGLAPAYALLVPVVLVVALAVPAWVAAAYRELTLPSDVATPLDAPAVDRPVVVADATLPADPCPGVCARIVLPQPA